MTIKKFSGGCQCGAVRFHVSGALGESSVCHCRMCQKASGAHALALVSVRDADFAWTRGAPAWFQSSNAAKRGFCAACGTPLAYDAPDGLSIAVASFDQPDLLPPVISYGVEAKLKWADGVAQLPERLTMDDAEAEAFLKTLVTFQHPDHDTESWPPKDKT